MTRELEAFERIKNHTLSYTGGFYKTLTDSREKEIEDLDIIESVINDNHFYKYMISRICDFMGLDINPFEDLVKTENEMIDYICENECFRADVVTNKNKLKALEIIKETPEFAWYVKVYKNAYEMVSDVKGFRTNNSVEELQEKFDLLKEVLK